MKKRIAVGVAGTIAVLGLAYVPGSPLEPGFEKKKSSPQEDSAWGRIRHVDKIDAEDSPEYDVALRSMNDWCGEKGLPAEVWAERNAEGDLEILGRCTRTFRSGP